MMNTEAVITEAMVARSLYSCCAVVRWMCESLHSRACSHYNAVYRKPILLGEDWIREVQQFASSKVKQCLGIVEKIKDGSYITFSCEPALISLLTSDYCASTQKWSNYFNGEPGLLRVMQVWEASIAKKEKHLVMIYMILRASGLCNPANSNWVINTEKPISSAAVGKILSSPLRLDDFVLDKHTAEGRSNGKGKADFVNIGATVVKEAYFDEDFRQFYVALGERQTPFASIGKKRKSSSSSAASAKKQTLAPSSLLQSEKVMFGEAFIRAQVNTGTKPDTYFVKHPLRGDLFVKGPFMKRAAAEVAILVNKVKHLLGLPFIHQMDLMELRVDLLPFSPVGTRKEGVETGWFLCCSSLLPINLMKLKLKKPTAKWPETLVVDWERLWTEHQLGCMKVERLLGEEAHQMLALFALRIWLGIPDQAWRNWLKTPFCGIHAVDDSALWSVDLKKKQRMGNPIKSSFLALSKDERRRLKTTIKQWSSMIDVIAPLLRVESDFLIGRLKKTWTCIKISMEK